MTAASPARRLHERPRALRLARPILLQYRAQHEHNWHDATALNISVSGMLLATRHPMRIHQSVQLRVAVPPEISGAVASVLTINCTVIRQQLRQQFGLRFDNAVAASTSANEGRVPSREPFHSLMHELSVIVGHCDLLQQLPTIEPQAAKSVRHIKQAAMNATATLRNGVA